MSTKGRYGLRVMMELAARWGHGPVLAETIAKNQDISEKYIRVLAGMLRTAGLVRTVRGRSGGYELARAPASITALDVISALEGRNVLVDCVLDAGSCPRADRCAARDVWCDVASAVNGVLSGLTLDQLSAKQRAKADESPSYCI